MEAVETFKIPELGDDSVEALFYAASLAYRAAKFDDAYTVYRGLAVARPAWSRPQVGMGAALYSLGRAQEAEAAYLEAILRDRNDQEAHLYLGELIWNERKDADAAATHLNTAFRIDPNNRFGERARFILSSLKK